MGERVPDPDVKRDENGVPVVKTDEERRPAPTASVEKRG